MSSLWRNLRFNWPLHFALVLTNLLPNNVPFLRLRGWLAACFLGSCAGDLRVGRNVYIYNPAQLRVGRSVYLAWGTVMLGGDLITIGDEVMVGPYCVLGSSDHTSLDGSFRYAVPRRAPIVVGKGSWLA
jgi:maltose O-acetyltransferase